MKFAYVFPLIGMAVAAPTERRSGPVTSTVNEALASLCSDIGGTQLTSTVCETVTGTQISVGAVTSSGLATVVISGQGLLEGASITVPVESLQGVLSQLGLAKRDVGSLGSGIWRERADPRRGLDVDLGGADLRRGLDVDLGGADLRR